MRLIVPLLICIFFLPGLATAQKAAQLPELAKPFLFYPDGDRIYVTEGITTFIYSAKDYKLLKKFGKEGEGPGEVMLRRAGGNTEIFLDIQPDHIICNSIRKLIFFSKDGEFIEEKPTKAVARIFAPIGDYYAGFTYTRGENRNLRARILLFNSKFETVREIYSQVHNWRGANADFNPLIIDPPLFEVGGDIIFVMNEEGTVVRGYNTDGKTLFEITNKNEPVPYTQKDKDRILEEYKLDPFWKRYYERRKHMFKFPGHYPPINFFTLDRPGKKVYVSTYEVADEKRKWVIYDFKGRFIKEVILPSEGIFKFYKDKCYRLAENEDEEIWELFITPLF